MAERLQVRGGLAAQSNDVIAPRHTHTLSLRGRNGVNWAGAAVASAETVLLAVQRAVGGRGKKISYRREAEDGQVVGNRGRGLLAC